MKGFSVATKRAGINYSSFMEMFTDNKSLTRTIQLMHYPGYTPKNFKVLAMRDLHQLIFGILRLEKYASIALDHLQAFHREILT
jgi:hypothetical protein